MFLCSIVVSGIAMN